MSWRHPSPALSHGRAKPPAGRDGWGANAGKKKFNLWGETGRPLRRSSSSSSCRESSVTSDPGRATPSTASSEDSARPSRVAGKQSGLIAAAVGQHDDGSSPAHFLDGVRRHRRQVEGKSGGLQDTLHAYGQLTSGNGGMRSSWSNGDFARTQVPPGLRSSYAPGDATNWPSRSSGSNFKTGAEKRPSSAHGRQSGAAASFTRGMVGQVCASIGVPAQDALLWAAKLEGEYLLDLPAFKALDEQQWSRLRLPIGLESALRRRLGCTNKTPAAPAPRGPGRPGAGSNFRGCYRPSSAPPGRGRR
eukprot:TRINITY_DN83560_c0_g1_i1.p1 TRINITY_DN83560_c0_g1~~TRINITY_DN83560_c0_g1_i1.p1  ORF type:complete len:303 (+),score=42.91 TRINITY_DN83560_c0_g1_i1:136-1044(+)